MLRVVRAGDSSIEYELVKTARVSVECRVLPEGVRVYAPIRMAERDVDEMVRRRAGWIEAAVSQARAREAAKAVAFPMTDGSWVPLEGARTPLRVRARARKDVRLEDGTLVVELPEPTPERVAEALEIWLRALARTRFSERVAYHAPRIGRAPRAVAVRGQKTRWGSCSALGNISLNWTLVMAPPGALDYVVVHEMCHLLEMNHSARFWNLVSAHAPQAGAWRAYLKSDWPRPFS